MLLKVGLGCGQTSVSGGLQLPHGRTEISANLSTLGLTGLRHSRVAA
jgi:hypothetical protein